MAAPHRLASLTGEVVEADDLLRHPSPDRLFIEAQPGHIQNAAERKDLESAQRDALRADKLRTEFASFAKPAFTINGQN